MKFEELQTRIGETSRKLEVSPIKIAKVVADFSGGKKFTTADLIRRSGIPQKNLYRVVSEFGDLLKPQGKFVEAKDEISKEIHELAIKLIKETVTIDKAKIEMVLKKYQNLRPTPDRQLDQFNATVATTVKRVVKMAKNGDLWGKEIAFLGDDDLTSVAATLTAQPAKVVVFEIDERLIKMIKKISDDLGLEIEVVEQDLRKQIDVNYVKSFDIVFTDPPYTREGINLFVNQGINLLKEQLTSKLYLCYGNSDRAREREVEIQALITEHRLLIQTKLNRFNKYQGASSIGANSSLYILDWTPQTRLVKALSSRIYTHE